MKKPAALTALIEELKAENTESTVGTNSQSGAKIFINDEAFEEDDAIVLTRQECSLLLHSAHTVKTMVEAIGEPEESSIEIHELDLAADVLDVLEKKFVSVDES